MKLKVEESPKCEKGEGREEVIINENTEENLPELKNMNVQIEQDDQGSRTMYENRPTSRHNIINFKKLGFKTFYKFAERKINHKGSEIRMVFDFSIAILQTRR